MYSFGPLPNQKKSGRIVGTHQKIDRIARRHLTKIIGEHANFPNIKDILHFEGIHGPDGVKLRSPGIDEPKHFINPKLPYEGELLTYIDGHIINLANALRQKNQERAAFEASWLAHAVTDGLTPAHQIPYEEMVNELWGDSTSSRDRVRDKVIIEGKTPLKTIKNSWEYWGPKGILSSHTLFEAGVAMAIRGRRFSHVEPIAADYAALASKGFETLYVQLVQEVAALDMYESFKRTGWTENLGRQTNNELMPRIIKAVILAWYSAYELSQKEVNAR